MAYQFDWDQLNKSWDGDRPTAAARLEAALHDARNEQEIMRFLKENPYLLAFSELRWGSNDLHLFFEFRLSTERSIDVLILGQHSGAWCPTFVEVQDPNASLFDRKGDPSPATREGVRQIGQWREFLKRNDMAFRQELARRLPAKSIARSPRHKFANAEVLDPTEHFDFNWWVLVGRSKGMSDKDAQNRRVLETTLNGIKVATFDRLLNAWARG